MSAFRRGFLVALLGLFVALPAMARPGGQPGGGPGGPGRLPSPAQLDRLADEIGLDAATKEKLKGQIQAAREAGKAMHQAVQGARAKLHELLRADNPDRAAVMNQIAELGKLQTAAQQHRIGSMLDVFGALTPEQRAKLREKMGQWREGRGKGKGGKGGHRGKGGRGGPWVDDDGGDENDDH